MGEERQIKVLEVRLTEGQRDRLRSLTEASGVSRTGVLAVLLDKFLDRLTPGMVKKHRPPWARNHRPTDEAKGSRKREWYLENKERLLRLQRERRARRKAGNGEGG